MIVNQANFTSQRKTIKLINNLICLKPVVEKRLTVDRMKLVKHIFYQMLMITHSFWDLAPPKCVFKALWDNKNIYLKVELIYVYLTLYRWHNYVKIYTNPSISCKIKNIRKNAFEVLPVITGSYDESNKIVKTHVDIKVNHPTKFSCFI